MQAKVKKIGQGQEERIGDEQSQSVNLGIIKLMILDKPRLKPRLKSSLIIMSKSTFLSNNQNEMKGDFLKILD